MGLYKISINGKRLVTAVQDGAILPDSFSWAADPPGIVDLTPLGNQCVVSSIAPGTATVTQTCVSTSEAILSDTDQVEVFLTAATTTDMVWGEEEPK